MCLSRTRLACNGFYSITGAVTLYVIDVKCQLRKRGDYVMARKSSKDVKKDNGVRRKLTKKNDISRTWVKKIFDELNANKNEEG